MISLSKIEKLGLGLGALLALAGCQYGGNGAKPAHEMSPTAMRCDKCQVTWVKTPYANGRTSGAVGYKDSQKMVCADCEEKMSNFFKTGKIMEHHCNACGGNMAACDTH
jgi:hypothetical protein